jgi:hypothetical protein
VRRSVGRASPVGQGETEEKAGRLRREAYLVGCLDAVHDVEAEHAAEDGADHHPHVRPPPRTRRRHRSPVSHQLAFRRRRSEEEWRRGADAAASG